MYQKARKCVAFLRLVFSSTLSYTGAMTKDNHPKKERTLVIIKPDGVQRTLIGEIIKRYERAGLKLVAMKMMAASAEQIEQHYTLDPEWRRITGEKRIKAAQEKGEILATNDPLEITRVVLDNLKKYMTSGPVVVMVWE